MIFEVQGQDGKTYEVDAEDAQTAAHASLQMQPQSTMGGYVKALGTGLGKGVSALAGLPGDLNSIVQKGVDWSAKNTLSPEKYQKGLEFQQQAPNILPSSENVQSAIEKQIGPFYQAQTPGEQRTETVGSFIPGLLTGGGGSLARRALTNVIAPAAGSQAAKEATEGNPQLQPFAQIGGAVVGGILGHHISNTLTPDKIPTGSMIRAAGSAGYEHPEVKALRINPEGAENLSTDIQKTLLTNKVDPLAAPETYKFIEGLKQPRFGPQTQVADLDMARQSLSTVPVAEKRAAGIARTAIDDYLDKIPAKDVAAGNPENVSKILTEARANWAAQAREGALQEAQKTASENAAIANSGRNTNNAQRRAVLKTVRDQEGLTPEEVAQAEKVWGGTYTGNKARYIANLMGAGGGLGQLAGMASGGYLLGGTPHSASMGALIALLTGNVAKHVGDASTQRNAALLSQMLRARSPLAQSMGATPSITDPMQNTLINALISSHSASGN